jgi:hypothetical protein
MNIVKLEERAMLVSLTIPTVQSVATAKTTTRRVVHEENASRDAVRVVAAKLPTARAAAVQAALDVVRSRHTALTLPFVGPFRLLRAETYLQYLSEVHSQIAVAAGIAQTQFGDREAVLADVAKQLGDIPFSEDDIPTASELAHRVTVKPLFMPIAQLFDNDLARRLDIRGDEFKAMNVSHASNMDRVAAASTADVLEEVRSAVERIVTSLVRYDEPKPEFTPDGRKTRRSGFHTTMVDNVKELAERLPKLDLTQDLALTVLSTPLGHLARYDTDTLKDSESARIEILQEAKDFLLSLDGEVSQISDFGTDEAFGGLL